MIFKIDPARCVRCGICVRECVRGVLIVDPDGKPAVSENGAANCNDCRHCLMVCPKAALSINEISPDDCPAPGQYPEYGSLLSLVSCRRSVRRFRPMNVSQKDLSKLLDALKYAPTGVNDHRTFFSVLNDFDCMESFRNKVNQGILDGIAKHRPGFEKYADLEKPIKAGKDPVFRTAPHLILAAYPDDSPCGDIDSVIALSYFELLANDIGFATCWCGRIMNVLNDVLPELYSEFHLPTGWKPGYAMLFGYGEAEYFRTANPSPCGLHLSKTI